MEATQPRQAERVDLATDVLLAFLATTRAFKGTEQAVLSKVVPHVLGLRFFEGASILRAGGPASFMGILFEGRAQVRQLNAISGEVLGHHEIRVGDHFGEVAAILNSAQPYEVTSVEESVVLVLPNKVFKWLAQRAPTFSLGLAQALASRAVRAGVVAISRPQISIRSDDDSSPPSSAIGSPLLSLPAPSMPSMPPMPSVDGVIPFVRTASYDINEKLTSLVPVGSILQHRFLPLELHGNTLTVGMVDPYSTAVVDEIDRLLHGIDLNVVAIGQDDYQHTLARLRLEVTPTGPMSSRTPQSISYEKVEQDREGESALNVMGKEVVAVVDKVILAGIEQGASDIHIEEERTGLRIRLRCHGLLADYPEYIPASFAKGVTARLKVLAGLDITERRVPQDGRIGLRIGRREIDFRVSTMPASRGEKIVMRMFEASNMTRPLEQIFLEQRTLKTVREVLGRPYGAIIVAGPTGSGKSSSLYACLAERMNARPDTNICVVEDPIEYRLSGVTQVQVNYATNLTFGRVLRAFLRQDPDVIMVGEMRDAETAQIALEAAMTGHLVFSSLHANNVAAAIERLANLGCNRTMVAQSVALILIQRLVRRLCPHCVVTKDASPILVKSLAERGLIDPSSSLQLPKAAGCDKCDHTGYFGRVAVIESLRLTDDVRAAMMANQTLSQIEEEARKQKLLVPFSRYASYLMARKIIAPGDALLAVAG